MLDLKSNLRDYLQKEIQVLNNLNYDEINDAMNEIYNCYNRGGNIYIFGNGGSAATASHFACDFNKGVSEKLDRKFNFICLSDNIATLMAIANDYCYDDVFVYQLKGRLKQGDLIIAISGSGNSKNVIKAIEYAKSENVPVIGITGYNGGLLKELSDYRMHVNIDDMQIAEDVHMIFDHMMMKVFCETLNK